MPAFAGMTPLFPETVSSSHLARVSDRSLLIAIVQLRNQGLREEKFKTLKYEVECQSRQDAESTGTRRAAAHQ